MIETAPAPPQSAARIVNVAAHLPEMARLQPFRAAVIAPHGRDRSGRVAYTHLTFQELDRECDRIAHGLERIGVRRGMRTALLVTPSLDFFALVFALFKVGAVIVLCDPGIGPASLGRCLGEAEPEVFVGIPKAHAARVLLGWARRTARIRVTVGRRLFWGGETLDGLRRAAPETPYPMPPSRPDEMAAILFTSGGTGVPKGAVYTHGVFAAQVEMLKRQYGIAPGEVDLATFPLFALFGPALGMTTLVPDMDASRPAAADPAKLVQAIADFGATNMFGSPALIDNLGRYGEASGVRLSSLRRVISAGAPVQARVIERLSRMLSPEAEVFTPYGATESLPVASAGSRELLLPETRARTEKGGGICVGRPVEGVRVRIIRIADEPIETWRDDLELPAGEIGEIVVSGQIVTREYWNRPEATRLAKVRVEGTGEVLHRMGDVGYLDPSGRLWFCGRKVHRVETAEGTMFTIPCEAVFNVHRHVRRSALVGVKDGAARRPVLCVELDPGAGPIPLDRLRAELSELGAAHPHTRAIREFLVHPGFPVDIRHNAKIFRDRLAVWAEGRAR